MKTKLTNFSHYQLKFILVNLLIILPIIIIGYLFYSDIEKRIQNLSSEQLGLSYIEHLTPLLKEIPVHRGLSMTFLSGGQSFQEKIIEQQKKIDQLFAQLLDWQNLSIKSEPWHEKIYKDMGIYKNQWEYIKSDLLNQSPEETLKIQTQLFRYLANLVENVANYSGLYRNAYQDSHLLMELLVIYLPSISNSMGEVRARVTVAAEAGVFSNENKEKITIKLAYARLVQNRIEHHYKNLKEINPEIAQLLLNKIQKLIKSVDILQTQITKISFQNNKISTSSDSIFNQTTIAINSSFSTIDTIIPALNHLLQLQIKRQLDTQRLTLILLFVAVLLVFIVSFKYFKMMNFFKITLDTTNDAVFMFTEDNFKFFYVNQKSLDFLGYSQTELMNMTPMDINSNLGECKFNEKIAPLINKQKEVIIFESQYKKKNSTLVPVEVSLQYLHTNRKTGHFICIVRDITERKQMQKLVDKQLERLQESKDRFSFAVEGAGDGVWDWNVSTNTIQFSHLWLDMLGYKFNELPHHLDTWINLLHPDELEQSIQHIMDYIEGRIDSYSTELRLRCKNGDYKWILCRGTAVEWNEKGKVLRMVGIHTDISKQKQAEQLLIDSKKEAEQASRAKSQFLSNMSHELRTPMNAILGFSQLVGLDRNNPLSKIQGENIAEITKAGNHLLALIDEILDLAKIESGHIELSIDQVILAEVLNESLDLIKPMVDSRGIDITLIKDHEDIGVEQLPQLQNTVWADYTRLKQALLNLLSNAVKYNSEKGKITISCEHNNNKLRITITDTGQGLSIEQQSQLFEPFNRIHNENSAIEGTGIGLAITKNIVELMGGNIGVISDVGKGCSFWIELPCGGDTIQDDSAIATASTMDNNHLDNSGLAIDARVKSTVLYIEDNPANLRLVSQLLGQLPNIHLLSAPEPYLGIELAIQHQPELILLDINLPGLSGYEVLKRLKQHEDTAKVPVIAISANAMPSDIKKGLKAGFDEYITKPIDLNNLLKTVELFLSEKN